MFKREFDIYSLAHENGLTPKIIEWKKINDDHYDLTTERYPNTLHLENNWLQYNDQLYKLVKKLHSLGIYHNELTHDNVVVRNGILKLVGFNASHLKPMFYDLNVFETLLQEEIDSVKQICREK